MVEANIVRDCQIGNTRIKIADNYCKKSQAEVEVIMRRITQQARRHICAAASTGNYELQETKKI